MKTKRPLSVTVVILVILAINTLSLLGVMMTVDQPLIQQLLAYLPIVVSIACAILMFFGVNRARWTYIICGVVFLLIGLFTTPEIIWLIPGVVIFAVFAFFLLRRDANAFFTSRKTGGSGSLR